MACASCNTIRVAVQFFLVVTLVSLLFSVVRRMAESKSGKKGDDGWGDL